MGDEKTIRKKFGLTFFRQVGSRAWETCLRLGRVNMTLIIGVKGLPFLASWEPAFDTPSLIWEARITIQRRVSRTFYMRAVVSCLPTKRS